MSDLTKIGIAKAHCGGTNYVPIGVVFRDGKDKLVIKIDSLPLGASGWTGWINVVDSEAKKPTAHKPFPNSSKIEDYQDDIPF